MEQKRYNVDINKKTNIAYVIDTKYGVSYVTNDIKTFSPQYVRQPVKEWELDKSSISVMMGGHGFLHDVDKIAKKIMICVPIEIGIEKNIYSELNLIN